MHGLGKARCKITRVHRAKQWCREGLTSQTFCLVLVANDDQNNDHDDLEGCYYRGWYNLLFISSLGFNSLLFLCRSAASITIVLHLWSDLDTISLNAFAGRFLLKKA